MLRSHGLVVLETVQKSRTEEFVENDIKEFRV